MILIAFRTIAYSHNLPHQIQMTSKYGLSSSSHEFVNLCLSGGFGRFQFGDTPIGLCSTRISVVFDCLHGTNLCLLFSETARKSLLFGGELIHHFGQSLLLLRQIVYTLLLLLKLIMHLFRFRPRAHRHLR